MPMHQTFAGPDRGTWFTLLAEQDSTGDQACRNHWSCRGRNKNIDPSGHECIAWLPKVEVGATGLSRAQ